MNATEARLGVWSEAGRLRRVMVCSPGLAHQRLTPDNCERAAVRRRAVGQQAKRDHFDFVTKMLDRGVEVLEMQDLLTDVVAIPKPGTGCWTARSPTIGRPGPHPRDPGVADRAAARSAGRVPDRRRRLQDVPDEVGGSFCSCSATSDPAFVLRPLPNTQFTRDNTSWIFRGVTLNPMYWPARRQETLLTAAIYKFHPAFADEKFEIWFGDPDARRPRRWPPSRAAT